MKYLFLCLSMAIACRGLAQDVAPRDGTESVDLKNNESEVGGHRRVLFHVQPIHCPGDMVSYPGPGTSGSWICGCRPGFLYLTSTNSCHEAFRRGPCPPGQYVYLSNDGLVPGCSANPCTVDGLVPYKGACYPLKRLGAPCDNDTFLFVDERTFRVECITISGAWPAAHVIVKAPNNGRNDRKCPPGTRRDPAGVCKRPIP